METLATIYGFFQFGLQQTTALTVVTIVSISLIMIVLLKMIYGKTTRILVLTKLTLTSPSIHGSKMEVPLKCGVVKLPDYQCDIYMDLSNVITFDNDDMIIKPEQVSQLTASQMDSTSDLIHINVNKDKLITVNHLGGDPLITYSVEWHIEKP